MNIEFFELADGNKPAAEFIDSLDDKTEAKMLRMLDLLEEHGGQLREPFSKALEDGLFELRAQQGNNITRVIYFFFVGNKAILTHGFTKKSQKTPPREIERAKRYRKEYQERMKGYDL
ncbi:MAG: type II toxin-antitoxin system RelE/ParE family toxin [Oscillospiraceae bacterium]|nr:type II toxin-antitoxin system RelE/ParE family toxin [Oscillospiraceae bacterium]